MMTAAPHELRPTDLKGFKAISYARFSSDAQKGGTSIARQETNAKAFCETYGLVPEDHVLITCTKANWFKDGKDDTDQPRPGGYAKGSRMFTSTRWIANTTRGTNDHAHCSHMIYLYDQRMNPFIKRWLGQGWDRSAEDRYALTELVQWIYRSRVRKGEPVTVFIPSKRMRELLDEWLNSTVEEPVWSGALVRA